MTIADGWAAGLAAAWMLVAGVALAGELGISYVKTLGPNPPEAEVFQTLGGRLAVDETAALYCGTPGGGSSLHKLTPEGRLVWNHFLNVPGFQGTAVDGEFLYTCGSGYCGYRQVDFYPQQNALLYDTGKVDLLSAAFVPGSMPVGSLRR